MPDQKMQEKLDTIDMIIMVLTDHENRLSELIGELSLTRISQAEITDRLREICERLDRLPSSC